MCVCGSLAKHYYRFCVRTLRDAQRITYFPCSCVCLPPAATQALRADVSSSDAGADGVGGGGNGGQLHARKCDVTNESEVLAAFAWIRSTFGGVDVFVNNAGRMQAAFMIGAYLYYIYSAIHTSGIQVGKSFIIRRCCAMDFKKCITFFFKDF